MQKCLVPLSPKGGTEYSVHLPPATFWYEFLACNIADLGFSGTTDLTIFFQW